MGEPRALGSAYLLGERIGRGATGEVWSASIRGEDANVAVKVLRPELGGDPEIVARFLREATTLTKLSHPNIVRIRDMVAEGGTLAIVMDLAPGTDLRQQLASNLTLPAGLTCQLGAQVAAGLEAAHAGGVVHRDLKPENILVNLDGDAGSTARVTDFGVAALSWGPTLTRHSQVVGTPEYLAPELASGGEVTGAADIYALGIVLYELLGGHPPFTGAHPMAVLNGHLNQPPAPLEGLPDDLWRLIAACLDKDPARRPSATAVRQTLTELAPRMAHLPPLPPRPRTQAPAPPAGIRQDDITNALPTRTRLAKTSIGTAPRGKAGTTDDKTTPQGRRRPLIAGASAVAAALVLVLLATSSLGAAPRDALRRMLTRTGGQETRATGNVADSRGEAAPPSQRPSPDPTDRGAGRRPGGTTGPGSPGSEAPGQPGGTPAPRRSGSGAGSTPAPAPDSRESPPVTTRPRQPRQVDMYRVWRQTADGQAHGHRIEDKQWTAQRFIATAPWVRAVEVNVGGKNFGVSAIAIRLMRLDGRTWVDVRTTPYVPLVENGVTRLAYDNPVPVRPGGTYIVQVFAGHGPIMVFFSNFNEDSRVHSYLWRPPGSDPEACYHGAEEMNMRVVGSTSAS